MTLRVSSISQHSSWALSAFLTTSWFLYFRGTILVPLKHIGRPAPPSLGHAGSGKQALDFMAIASVDAKYVSDGEIMIGPRHHPDGIASPHVAFADDSQVSAGSQRLREAARKHLIVHANAQPPARDSRLRNLKNYRPDPPALSDERIVHRNSFGREILAKLTVGKGPADLLFPPACILNGIGVDRFVGSPVCLAIRLVISGKIHASGCDPTGDRRFPDRTPGRATVVFELARQADVDGENLAYGSRHELFSFQVRPATGLSGFGSAVVVFVVMTKSLPAPELAAAYGGVPYGLSPMIALATKAVTIPNGTFTSTR
jgi:hypothetical protein